VLHGDPRRVDGIVYTAECCNHLGYCIVDGSLVRDVEGQYFHSTPLAVLQVQGINRGFGLQECTLVDIH